MRQPHISREALPKVLQRFADKIHSVDDERSSGNGIWVVLRDGWLWQNDCHQIHENSFTACARQFGFVEPCACADCQKGMAEEARQ